MDLARGMRAAWETTLTRSSAGDAGTQGLAPNGKGPGQRFVRVDAGNDSKYGARTAVPFKRFEQVNKCETRTTRRCFHYTKVGP